MRWILKQRSIGRASRMRVWGASYALALSVALVAADGECQAEQQRASRNALPARTGFQMHVVPLSAFGFPVGRATGAPGDALSTRYSWQWVPFEIGLGAKVVETLYVGGYLDTSIGAEGSDRAIEQQCDDDDYDLRNDVACRSTTVHAGIEARYSFAPDAGLNPWVGYGFGFTLASQRVWDDRRYSETVFVTGLDLARLSAGFDWRLAQGFGMGPFFRAAVGRYSETRTEIGSAETHAGDIADPVIHGWLTLGMRLVIQP